MDELRIITPTGCLGYGFDERCFWDAVRRFEPHVLAVDAGSTDPGPYYLGAGVSFTNRLEVQHELEVLIAAALDRDIPLIVGTVGGSGGRPHVAWTLDIVKDLCRRHGWRLRVATIDAEVDSHYLKQKLAAGDVMAFESDQPLTEEVIDASSRIVAQMGPEPIIEALRQGAQVILAGRACDDAIFAAYPLMNGFDPGLSTHMGKILECGALASEPVGMDVMLGILRRDHFDLVPAGEHRACTVTSVMAHSLYERENPLIQKGPGGLLDLSQVVVEPIDHRTVRVRGSRYVPADEYAVKLEGARVVGYRTVSIAGVRCPVMIQQLDDVLAETERRTAAHLEAMGIPADTYRLIWHVYGRDAVMKGLEPRPTPAHEVGLVLEVVAPTEELANTICHHAAGRLLHIDFPGQYNNAGNLAFLYSPAEFSVGQVYEWSVYHLMRLSDPLECFPVTIHEIAGHSQEEVALDVANR